MTIGTETLGSATLGTALAVAVAAALPAPLPAAGLVDDCYLVVAQGYAGDGTTAPSWIVEALGTFPAGTTPTPFAAGQTIGLYWSDRGYTTTPSDSLPNVHFDARARQPLLIDRAVPVTPESGSRATLQLGSIEIDNADGTQDDTADLAIDARPVTILYGDRTAAFSTFATLFSGSGIAWERTSDALRLAVRGRDYLLDVPLQSTLYGGTGGADGGAELKGKPLPQLYGICRDVTPVTLVTSSLIYQVNDRAVYAIDAVYDRAQALIFDADYASYAALAAASAPAGGHYATCLAAGMFRLGSTPAGIVTADVRGDAHAASGGYVANPAQIARRLILDRGGLTTADLDEDGIAATAFDVAATAGYYFTEATTVSAAVSTVCAGAFLWWAPMRDGSFTVRRFQGPGAPRYEIGVTDIVAPIEAIALPESVDPCNWRRRVDYMRCWTPQTGTEIDNASLTAARRAFISQAARTAFALDTARQTRHQLATDPPALASALDQENDAETLADNLLTLFAPGRRMFRVPIRLGGHDLDLDDTVRVTNPRFGLSSGRDFRIFAMDEKHADRRVDLLVFG
ncbi:MAG: hypothetical protein GC202_02050 [Alphaproteobacteria bacterium]|nr:hypothetical protein [Alphaproteobacteria bacterium]